MTRPPTGGLSGAGGLHRFEVSKIRSVLQEASMRHRRVYGIGSIWLAALVLQVVGSARAQGPNVETELPASMVGTPGSNQSRLGRMPGAGEMILGTQPGRDDLLLGRIGTAAAGSDVDHQSRSGGPGSTSNGYPGPRSARPSCSPLRHAGVAIWRGRRGTSQWPDARPGDRATAA